MEFQSSGGEGRTRRANGKGIFFGNLGDALTPHILSRVESAQASETNAFGIKLKSSVVRLVNV